MKDSKRKKIGLYPVLDLYILREFMIPFSILIVSFVVLFMLGDMFERLSVFTNSRTASLWDTVCYFAYKVPGNVRFVLPISLLLACMYTMANFGKHAEITAMRASGVSLIRAGLSIYIVAIVITFATFWVNEGLVPEFDRKAFELQEKAGGHEESDAYDMLVFRSADQQRWWGFKDFDELRPIQNTPIMLRVYRPNGDLSYELRADSAVYVQDDGWYFFACTRIPFFAETHLPGQRQFLDSLYLNSVEVPESHRDVASSIKPADELPMMMLIRRIQQTPPDCELLLAKFETILYFRFAFPFSCLIGVLLGVPLAARSMRNGIMIPIIIAALVVVIYMMCAQIFQVLGQNMMVPSVVGGLAPTVSFLFYAIFQVYRSD